MDWVFEVGGKIGLSALTMHIAVAYMDYVLAKVEVPKNKYFLTATACLYLAAKYDELDKRIPPIHDLLRASLSKLSTARVEDIKECEVMLLRTMAWNLKIITPLVFVEVLLTQGVLYATDKIDEKDAVSVHTSKLVCKHALEFVKIVE